MQGWKLIGMKSIWLFHFSLSEKEGLLNFHLQRIRWSHCLSTWLPGSTLIDLTLKKISVVLSLEIYYSGTSHLNNSTYLCSHLGHSYMVTPLKAEPSFFSLQDFLALAAPAMHHDVLPPKSQLSHSTLLFNPWHTNGCFPPRLKLLDQGLFPPNILSQSILLKQQGWVP